MEDAAQTNVGRSRECEFRRKAPILGFSKAFQKSILRPRVCETVILRCFWQRPPEFLAPHGRQFCAGAHVTSSPMSSFPTNPIQTPSLQSSRLQNCWRLSIDRLFRLRRTRNLQKVARRLSFCLLGGLVTACNMFKLQIALFSWRKAHLFVQTEAIYDFVITNVEDQTLLSSLSGTELLLLRASYRYVIDSEHRKCAFYPKELCSAAVQHMNALHALFTAVHHNSTQRFCFSNTSRAPSVSAARGARDDYQINYGSGCIFQPYAIFPARCKGRAEYVCAWTAILAGNRKRLR